MAKIGPKTDQISLKIRLKSDHFYFFPGPNPRKTDQNRTFGNKTIEQQFYLVSDVPFRQGDTSL